MQVIWELPTTAESPVALTIGKFDGVHLGHLAVIRQLKQLATQNRLPACALTFDPHPLEFFMPDRAPRRLTTVAEKIWHLERHGIDRLYVCPFDQAMAATSARDFVHSILARRLAVHYLLVGEDFRFGAGRSGDIKLLIALGKEAGMEVSTIDDFKIDGVRVSSTSIREAMAKGDKVRARRFLGREPEGMFRSALSLT